MNKKGIFKALPILFFLTVIVVVVLFYYWRVMNRDTVIISHESGVYTAPFRFRIDTIKPGDIYYTMDGSIPDIENEKAMLYEEPIPIELGTEKQTYSLQIKCYFEDGEESPVFSREYVMDPEGITRFQTKYIVSITGDEDALWGYENGIFVGGRQFDEYMAANPDVDINNVMIPANYYSDKEVPVHVTIFTGEGQEIVSKNCGLKIYGYVTRAKNQKSFRLYARKDYDGDNEFRYAFLPKLISGVNNSVIDEFQRISFHNSGNDNGYAFVRTALIGELARQFQFDDVLVSESAVVYVNGRYQGLYWLQNAFDDKYFKEKYGQYTGEMVICEGELSRMNSSKQEIANEVTCLEEYNEFCEWIKGADLSVEQNWERVCATIDIENFAKYMAIEYYVGNIDWPHNNVKVYRYVSSEGYEENTVFDGRYRYLLFDTDYGFGLKFLGWFGYDEYSKSLQDLCDVNGAASLFACMMQREEFKSLFVNSVLVMSQGVFKESNVQAALDKYCQTKDAELQYMFEQTDLLKNSLWESDDNSFVNVETEHAEILAFSRNRPKLARSEMQEVLACGNQLELSVVIEGNGEILIDGVECGGVYEGYCFENIPMAISCVLPVGSKVNGYYLNDEYVSGGVLELKPSEWNNKTDRLVICPDIEMTPKEQLSILAYDIDGEGDYIVLGNTGNVELLLSDYSISDSLKTSKGRLPSVVLQPGEEYYVYGKKYTGDIADNGIKVSFSWNTEETIILSNNEKGIIEQR